MSTAEEIQKRAVAIQKEWDSVPGGRAWFVPTPRSG